MSSTSAGYQRSIPGDGCDLTVMSIERPQPGVKLLIHGPNGGTHGAVIVNEVSVPAIVTALERAVVAARAQFDEHLRREQRRKDAERRRLDSRCRCQRCGQSQRVALSSAISGSWPICCGEPTKLVATQGNAAWAVNRNAMVES